MGNKNKKERKDSHANFENKLKIQETAKRAELSDDHFRLAAVFAAENPEQAAQHCDLPAKVLSNIAAGRFSATIPQRREISAAVAAMGWTPPEA